MQFSSVCLAHAEPPASPATCNRTLSLVLRIHTKGSAPSPEDLYIGIRLHHAERSVLPLRWTPPCSGRERIVLYVGRWANSGVVKELEYFSWRFACAVSSIPRETGDGAPNVHVRWGYAPKLTGISACASGVEGVRVGNTTHHPIRSLRKSIFVLFADTGTLNP